MRDGVLLDGRSLTPEGLARAARGGVTFNISDECRARMVAARAVVERAVADRVPVYGVTTGLGARVTEALDHDALTAFSYQTIRGRAHAVGKPALTEIVRAAMIARANTLVTGAAGASPAVCDHYLACLNAGLTPVVGELGSIGAADLVWNATAALALIGEGPMENASGQIGPGAEVMQAAEIVPPSLGPRDGLAMCNSSSYSAALSGLACAAAMDAYSAAQSAAALSMEGFVANLSPLDPRVLGLREQAGQAEAAAELMHLLDGSALKQTGAARRLQDPISIRNVVQVHGAVCAALSVLNDAAMSELNGASDNPAVLLEDAKILSIGNYFTPHLCIALETASRSFVHLAMAQLARLAKLQSPRFSDLPLFLAAPGSTSNGFAPVMKTAEAVVSKLVHAAQPVAVWPSINADGAEDALTNTPTAAQALIEVAECSATLTAIELLVAAQAVELRGGAGRLGAPMQKVLHVVRERSPALTEDRPLGGEITTVAEAIRDGVFSVGSDHP